MEKAKYIVPPSRMALYEVFIDARPYRPASTSLGSDQVLHCPYNNKQARLIAWEMADQLILNLVKKRLVKGAGC